MPSVLTPELYPIFWLILGIVLAVIEALTVQLVAIWFAAGAVAAIIPALLRAPMWVQLLVFVAASGVMLLLTRPLVQKLLRVKKVHTNADNVIGQSGLVLETIDNDRAQGRVQAMGLDWSARTNDGTILESGRMVTVLAIEGVKLLVQAQEAPRGVQKEE